MLKFCKYLKIIAIIFLIIKTNNILAQNHNTKTLSNKTTNTNNHSTKKQHETIKTNKLLPTQSKKIKTKKCTQLNSKSYSASKKFTIKPELKKQKIYKHDKKNIDNEMNLEVTKELSTINNITPLTPKAYTHEVSNTSKIQIKRNPDEYPLLHKEQENSPSTITKFTTKSELEKIHKKNITIIIDPGHGGKDPGAVGANNTLEKNVVLSIAKYLQQNLNQQKHIKAILTRSGDYFIPLRQRLKIARHHHGNLFISIHADAYMDPYAKGATVYALSLNGATSEAARFLAKKENESELGSVIANKNRILQSVLVNLIQTASISTSLDIGYEIIHQLDNITKLHHNVIEQAAFVVLKEPEIPSLLVETGFISNLEEEAKLCTPEYQQEIAAALSAGINNYLAKHPNFNVSYG